jgi:hypothetical protein
MGRSILVVAAAEQEQLEITTARAVLAEAVSLSSVNFQAKKCRQS